MRLNNKQDDIDMARKKNEMVAYGCRYFLGDRPCKWHKKEGVSCVCRYFTPVQENILIIKLDAVGDVLRTTCLLPISAT